MPLSLGFTAEERERASNGWVIDTEYLASP